MDRYLTLLFTLLLGTCALAPSCSVGEDSAGDRPLPALGTATTPVRYADFAAVEPLFYQRTDTTYLINFWATWCRPCREELPLLQRLASARSGQKLRVVLVSLDTDEAAIARIPAFLGETAPDLASIILTDQDPAWGPTIDRAWNANLPTTILYRGDLRYIYRRAFNSFPDLETAVAPFLGRD